MNEPTEREKLLDEFNRLSAEHDSEEGQLKAQQEVREELRKKARAHERFLRRSKTHAYHKVKR